MYNLTGGKDYTPGPYDITFTTGRRSVTLYNPVIDDALVEKDEAFSLFINGSSLPDGIVVGDISYARVTIYDEDCKHVTINKIYMYNIIFGAPFVIMYNSLLPTLSIDHCSLYLVTKQLIEKL